MKSPAVHPRSLVLGIALALVPATAFVQKERDAGDWEYTIVTDVSEKDTEKLKKDGYEFVGYLGQSVKGTGSDETLWRRPD